MVIGYDDDKKEDYIITGFFFQSLCDTGNCFGMLETGAEKELAPIISVLWDSVSQSLKKKQEIVDYLNKNFGNSLEAKTVDSIAGEPVEVIINVIKAVIFILSFVFALVAVYMVCEKCFLQEKDDIAIYHALGFTKKKAAAAVCPAISDDCRCRFCIWIGAICVIFRKAIKYDFKESWHCKLPHRFYN